ncbi:YetF domain-containing protein [Pseudochelatococcus contaminans]|uniref:Uncharacterized membrane protein YcaP (DUF421 family) n=1 Tax=Pseudochelatococcus contaminans TaxID=1538103 RepID=A0A7W5Z245_9HYPH|nr:uncharacterized membrane protein YcaP (DUF421 family) [Pseudochelatococcus contaminans]
MEYYGYVLLKFIIGFVIIITHMNISGKTQLSQMTPIDFIGNFVLGGIIGGVIYSDSVPLYQYISVLLIGVVLISLLNFISKNLAAFRIFTIGEPIPIIKNGKFLMDNILQRKGKIDILNVASQMHLQGIHSFQEIYYAQIEPNGQLTAVCGRSRIPSVIVVKNGNIIANELSAVDLTEDDVQKALADLNIKPEDVFIGEFWDGGLSFVLNSGEVVKQQPAD